MALSYELQRQLDACRCREVHPVHKMRCGLRADHAQYGVGHRLHALRGFTEWAAPSVEQKEGER